MIALTVIESGRGHGRTSQTFIIETPEAINTIVMGDLNTNIHAKRKKKRDTSDHTYLGKEWTSLEIRRTTRLRIKQPTDNFW